MRSRRILPFVSTPASHRLAVVIVLGAMVGFGFKGILARFAYAEGVSVTALLLARAALATPLLWLFSLGFRGSFRNSSRADLAKAFASGWVFLCSSTFDFMAVERLGAGASRLILFVFPLLVLMIEAVRERRAPSRRELTAFVVAWAGLFIVSADSFQHGAQLSGILLGLAAATSHAAFLTLTQQTVRRMGSVPFTVTCNTGTAVAIFAYVGFFAPAGSVRYTADGALWLTLLAVFCTALPALLLVEGVKRMGAGPSSLVSLVGPVITLGAAYLLLDEPLTPQKVAGAALVIGAVGWHTLGRAQGAPRPVATATRPAER